MSVHLILSDIIGTYNLGQPAQIHSAKSDHVPLEFGINSWVELQL